MVTIGSVKADRLAKTEHLIITPRPYFVDVSLTTARHQEFSSVSPEIRTQILYKNCLVLYAAPHIPYRNLLRYFPYSSGLAHPASSYSLCLHLKSVEHNNALSAAPCCHFPIPCRPIVRIQSGHRTYEKCGGHANRPLCLPQLQSPDGAMYLRVEYEAVESGRSSGSRGFHHCSLWCQRSTWRLSRS